MMWLSKRNFSKATRQNLNISFAVEFTPAPFSVFRQVFAIQTIPALCKCSVISQKKVSPNLKAILDLQLLHQRWWNVLKMCGVHVSDRCQWKIRPIAVCIQTGSKHRRSINSVIPSVLKHLEDNGAYLQLLLIDFSSAFNTLQPHRLIQILRQLDVSPSIKWCYHSF